MLKYIPQETKLSREKLLLFVGFAHNVGETCVVCYHKLQFPSCESIQEVHLDLIISRENFCSLLKLQENVCKFSPLKTFVVMFHAHPFYCFS